MAIKEEVRGQGYGFQLLEKTIDHAKVLGYTQLSLSVDKENKALKLYQKSGFLTVRETEKSYIMARIIH